MDLNMRQYQWIEVLKDFNFSLFYADVEFVLRPHPFENIASYDALTELPNFHVRQDGTSLEWISGARLLVHQNCSTAIEATMLNVEPLSMEWFNTPSLRLDAATRVSRGAGSESDLIELVQQGLDGRLSPVAGETEQFRRQIIGDLFTAVDGANSSRVASAVLDAIAAARGGKRRGTSSLPQPSLRGIAAETARRALGYKASSKLRQASSTHSPNGGLAKPKTACTGETSASVMVMNSSHSLR